MLRSSRLRRFWHGLRRRREQLESPASRFPHRKIRELAEQDNISINQFIATAVAEKAAALLTVEYLAERGRRADPKLVDRMLSRAPDVPPVPGDELPVVSSSLQGAPANEPPATTA